MKQKEAAISASFSGFLLPLPPPAPGVAAASSPPQLTTPVFVTFCFDLIKLDMMTSLNESDSLLALVHYGKSCEDVGAPAGR